MQKRDCTYQGYFPMKVAGGNFIVAGQKPLPSATFIGKFNEKKSLAVWFPTYFLHVSENLKS